MTQTAPPLETNACNGTYVLAIATNAGWIYPQCAGCAGCDRDTVAARSAQMTIAQALALLPAIENEEAW